MPEPSGYAAFVNLAGIGAMDITIREETAADAAAIAAVTEAAFRDARHTSHTEQFIVAALRKAGTLAISLVATAGEIVIGHIAVSPVSISDGTPGWFGLGPVSVTPEHQRRGLGSRLVREALRLLREHGAIGCVVLGDPAYYGRFGFRPEPSFVLADVEPEYFQAVSFGGRWASGVVSYDGAFAVRGGR